MAEPFTSFSSALIPLPAENVDTDQIIPARFLKTTEKSGLADALFFDWRYDADGQPKPDFVVNLPEMQGRRRGFATGRWSLYRVQGRVRSVPGVFDRIPAGEAWEVRGILGLLFLSGVPILPGNECKLTASGGERD